MGVLLDIHEDEVQLVTPGFRHGFFRLVLSPGRRLRRRPAVLGIMAGTGHHPVTRRADAVNVVVIVGVGVVVVGLVPGQAIGVAALPDVPFTDLAHIAAGLAVGAGAGIRGRRGRLEVGRGAAGHRGRAVGAVPEAGRRVAGRRDAGGCAGVCRLQRGPARDRVRLAEPAGRYGRVRRAPQAATGCARVIVRPAPRAIADG